MSTQNIGSSFDEYSCQKVPLNIAGYVPHITAQMHHLLLH